MLSIMPYTLRMTSKENRLNGNERMLAQEKRWMFYKKTHLYVFSVFSTFMQSSWENSLICESGLLDEITKLKINSMESLFDLCVSLALQFVIASCFEPLGRVVLPTNWMLLVSTKNWYVWWTLL